VNPWTLLLQAIGSVLAIFYQIIPNYGVAIILLTLGISLILFPMTLKQTRSMRSMQEIQPEVKRLQRELKHDKEELNKQLMALYKERGVNPAAGCLPMLVQMPIWFALFRVLRSGEGIPTDSALWREAVGPARDAIEQGLSLGHQAFEGVRFLGMNLLASPSQAFSGQGVLAAIPYVLLVVVIVAAGFYQQMQTMQTKKDDGKQGKAAHGMQTAMKIMPLFFGFISWTLPAGLGLYLGTSNLFRIGQQALIIRLENGGDAEAGDTRQGRPAGGPSNGEGGGGNGKPPSGPSRHASKKRNRRRRK